MPKLQNAYIFNLAKHFTVLLAAFLVLASSVHNAESSFEHKNHSETCELCSLAKAFNFVESAPLELKVTMALTPVIGFATQILPVVSLDVKGSYDSRAPPTSL